MSNFRRYDPFLQVRIASLYVSPKGCNIGLETLGSKGHGALGTAAPVRFGLLEASWAFEFAGLPYRVDVINNARVRNGPLRLISADTEVRHPSDEIAVTFNAGLLAVRNVLVSYLGCERGFGARFQLLDVRRWLAPK